MDVSLFYLTLGYFTNNLLVLLLNMASFGSQYYPLSASVQNFIFFPSWAVLGVLQPKPITSSGVGMKCLSYPEVMTGAVFRTGKGGDGCGGGGGCNSGGGVGG